MSKLFFITIIYCCFSCNTSRYVGDELQFNQLTPVHIPRETVNSLLIVGTGGVEARQIIDISMQRFTNSLSTQKVYNGYFFVPIEELNEQTIVQKMKVAGSERFKYLLFISQEEPAIVTASGPRLALNLNMTLFEKDNDAAEWKASVNLFGKIYKKEHSERISDLLLMHLRANRFVP